MTGNLGSGLSRFVDGRHGSNDPPQSTLSRARNAERHKVPTNRKELQNAMLPPLAANFGQEHPPLYETKDEYRDDSGSEDGQRGQTQSRSPPNTFDIGNTLDSAEFESTITSDAQFDEHEQERWDNEDEPGSSGLEEEYDVEDRIKEGEVYNQQGHKYQRDDNYTVINHSVPQQQPPRRLSPIVTVIADHRTNIKPTHGSRFQNLTPYEHPVMVSRPVQDGNGGQPHNGSKKRLRGQLHDPHQGNNERPNLKFENHNSQGQYLQNQNPIPSDYQVTISPSSQLSEDASETSKGPDEDYDDEQLQAMSFQDLKDEAFEHNPRIVDLAQDKVSSDLLQMNAHLKSQTEDKSEPAGLEGRWKQCMKGRPEEQEVYYSKLSISEWEETGDLFIDRFSELMQKLRTARTNRRAIIAAGEREIEQREEMIRGKSASYDDEFRAMKRDGESVLRGKLQPSSTPRQASRKS